LCHWRYLSKALTKSVLLKLNKTEDFFENEIRRFSTDIKICTPLEIEDSDFGKALSFGRQML